MQGEDDDDDEEDDERPQKTKKGGADDEEDEDDDGKRKGKGKKGKMSKDREAIMNERLKEYGMDAAEEDEQQTEKDKDLENYKQSRKFATKDMGNVKAAPNAKDRLKELEKIFATKRGWEVVAAYERDRDQRPGTETRDRDRDRRGGGGERK